MSWWLDYGLSRQPFEGGEALYWLPEHEVLLAQLAHHLHFGDGWLVLVGVKGSGRSTLLAQLQSQLRADLDLVLLDLSQQSQEQALAALSQQLKFSVTITHPDQLKQSLAECAMEALPVLLVEGVEYATQHLLDVFCTLSEQGLCRLVLSLETSQLESLKSHLGEVAVRHQLSMPTWSSAQLRLLLAARLTQAGLAAEQLAYLEPWFPDVLLESWLQHGEGDLTTILSFAAERLRSLKARDGHETEAFPWAHCAVAAVVLVVLVWLWWGPKQDQQNFVASAELTVPQVAREWGKLAEAQASKSQAESTELTKGSMPGQLSVELVGEDRPVLVAASVSPKTSQQDPSLAKLDRVSVPVSPKTSSVQAVVEAVEEPELVDLIGLTEDEQRLLAWPAERQLIQLFAASSPDVLAGAEKFFQVWLGSHSSLRLRYRRKGQDLYVLLLGAFELGAELERIQTELRQAGHQPWLRSVADVQADVRQFHHL